MTADGRQRGRGGDGSRRRPKAAAKAAASCGWKLGNGRNLLVRVGKRLPAVFGTKEPIAGVELDFAEPREVAALTGDGRGDGARRLERRPEVEREGVAGRVFPATAERGRGATGRSDWWEEAAALCTGWRARALPELEEGAL
uniref:DUF834 domain-containing protein n=1 Tax=Oryza sativa subsp. japonica TaxID=39947 RepID=Q6Z588_ORYSJ|nr:hypothetical protein [Oryza sativa Japonica Group]